MPAKLRHIPWEYFFREDSQDWVRMVTMVNYHGSH